MVGQDSTTEGDVPAASAFAAADAPEGVPAAGVCGQQDVSNYRSFGGTPFGYGGTSSAGLLPAEAMSPELWEASKK